MNQKELNELRRRFRLDRTGFNRVYGCFVNGNKEIVSDLDESFGYMPEAEAERYLGLLKKVLSGRLGKNLIDIVFSTQQVMEGEEHKLLSALRDSELKDRETRTAFYQKVIDQLDMEGGNYLLLMSHERYDVPHRGGDDELQPDASDQTFSYFVCGVYPVKEGKAELGYFPQENEFHNLAAGQIVCPPELGFLFPAFDDRAANIYNALYYTRRPDQLHQEFIDAVFHTEAPMSAGEQKMAFETALCEGLEDQCSMEVLQAIHERIHDQLQEHKERKDPEPPTLTPADVGMILADQGVERERIAAFQEKCGEEFGENAVLNPENLIDPGKFQVKTEQITVSVDPEFSYLVETCMIDGKKYIMIPVGKGVEVNGLAVNVSAAQTEELS